MASSSIVERLLEQAKQFREMAPQCEPSVGAKMLEIAARLEARAAQVATKQLEAAGPK
jgi:hypothetical protein